MSFPILSVEPDRRYYSVEVENPVVRTEFEGGYVATRPRHRRSALRRTYTTGYTDMSRADKEALEAFYNAQKGGSKIFQWIDHHEWEGTVWEYIAAHPGTTVTAAKAIMSTTPHVRNVRFVDPLKFVPKGYGLQLRWDCPSIKLEEV